MALSARPGTRGDGDSEYTDSSETISEASSTWQFDERVTSGVRKLSFIEFKRTVDNVAVRPLFRDRDVAKEMLSFDLHISNRPMRIDEHSGVYDGIVSERAAMTYEPLTPLGEALDECIERCRHKRRKDRPVLLARAAQQGDYVSVREHLPLDSLSEIDCGVARDGRSEEKADCEFSSDKSPDTDIASGREASDSPRGCGDLVVADEPDDGLPGLLWSAMLDHRLVARVLLEGKVDPDTEDARGWTALMWAAHQNNAAAMRLLLDHGADPNHLNRYGSSALTWAAEQGNLNAVRILVSAGVDIDQATREGNTALLQSSGSGFEDVVDYCLAKGANVNARNEALQTPLIRAAEAGHLSVVRRILREGRRVDLDARDQFSQTALSLAQLWNSPAHIEMATLLDASLVERRKVLEEERKLLVSQQSNERRRRRRRSQESVVRKKP